MIKITTLLFGFILFSNLSYSQIRINEVCSSNSESLYDEDSDTPDWIELYNYSDAPVNLSNWKISDKNDFQSAWQLPDTTIEPGGFFLVYASGKGVISKNFKIVTNGVENTFNNFEDRLSWIFMELSGDNKFKVKYNGFKCELNTNKNLSLGGILIKEKNEPKSKMYGLFHYPIEGRQLFLHSRLSDDVYRDVSHFGDRVKLSENFYELERARDSLYIRIIDEKDDILMSSSHYFPFENKYFIGFTIITNDLKDFDTLDIDKVYLNNEELDLNKFGKMDFHGTQIFTQNSKNCHANFKLNSDGDSLFLYNDNTVSESISIPKLISDVSYSFLNAFENYYEKTTPGSENAERFEKLSLIDTIITDYFISQDYEFQNIDSNFKYTIDLTEPNIESNNLKEYNSDTSNFLIVKKVYSDQVNSNLFYLPKFSTELIINDLLHFHIFVDSSYLFNDYTGIINQTFNFAKVDANLAITQNNTGLYRGKVKLRKNGNFSNIWRNQTPFRLILNDVDNIKNQDKFFSDRGRIFGNSLLLRNGGDDEKTMLRSRFAYSTLKNTNLLEINYNTSIVYLNNEFWGVYHLRERIDDDFLADYHNVNKEEINSFENDLDLKYGSPKEMIDLDNILINEPNRIHYNLIDSIVDLDVFTDYIFVHTFNIQHDWPHNNVVAYTYGKKWKYLVTDFDYSYKYRGAGADIYYISVVFDKQDNVTTRILFNLLKSNIFINDFLNRSCDLLNTGFRSDSLVNGFLKLKDYFSQYRMLQNNRWPKTLANWEEDTEEVRQFLFDRPNFYYDQLQTYFNKKSAQLNITSFPNNAGGFKVNTLTIDESEWSGKYLQEVPVTITAIPKKGYKFKKWSIDSLGSTAELTISLPETLNLQAIYDEADPKDNSNNIVINEIMYNADKDKDTKDWIELYNAGTDAVNLNGWSLLDEDDTHTPYVIEEDYTIQPDEYVILTKSITDFESIIEIDNKIFGDFDFGFGGNDLVKLYDSDGNVHDTVNYDNDLPWPEGAVGTGYTIELIHPSLDNSLAENWELSKPELGTAGFVNSVYDDSISSVNNNADSDIIKFNFLDNKLTIISDSFITSFLVSDITGRKIEVDYSMSEFQIESDFSKLPDGLYICKVRIKNGITKTIKILND